MKKALKAVGIFFLVVFCISTIGHIFGGKNTDHRSVVQKMGKNLRANHENVYLYSWKKGMGSTFPIYDYYSKIPFVNYYKLIDVREEGKPWLYSYMEFELPDNKPKFIFMISDKDNELVYHQFKSSLYLLKSNDYRTRLIMKTAGAEYYLMAKKQGLVQMCNNVQPECVYFDVPAIKSLMKFHEPLSVKQQRHNQLPPRGF